MEFCQECGSMMKAGEDGGWVCASCGYEEWPAQNKRSNPKNTIQHKQSKIERLKNELKEVRNKLDTVTNTKIPTICPNCGKSGSLIDVRKNEPLHLVCDNCHYRWNPEHEVSTCPDCGLSWGEPMESTVHKQSGEEDSPVDLGEDYSIELEDVTKHHSGERHFVGQYKGFNIFVTRSPNHIEVGDEVTVRITSFGKSGSSANAKVINSSEKPGNE